MQPTCQTHQLQVLPTLPTFKIATPCLHRDIPLKSPVMAIQEILYLQFLPFIFTSAAVLLFCLYFFATVYASVTMDLVEEIRKLNTG